MKILAIVLLLLNIAYAIWMNFGAAAQQTAQTERDAAQPRFVQADERLVLLSERPAAPRPEAIASEVVVQEPVIPEESIATAAPGAVETPAETAVAEVVAAPTPWCARVTGLPTEDQATKVMRDLNAMGGSAELESETVPVSSTWWVHLPPFPTEEAARAVLTELQAKQIDSFYIRSGELAGAISLGVFRGPERAAVAQREFGERGYVASIREILRMGTRYNVSLRLEDAQMRDAAEWVDLQAEIQDAELQEIACK